MEQDQISIIDDQNVETPVDDKGKPLVTTPPPPSDDDMSGIDMSGMGQDDKIEIEEPIKVVEDGSPELQQLPETPEQAGTPEPSAIEQLQAQMNQFLAAQAEEKAKQERAVKVNEIKENGYKIAKEHNDLVKQKTSIMSNPQAFKNGVLTPEAAAQITQMDSKIMQLNAEHVANEKDLKEAQKEPETPKVAPEVMQWRQNNPWIDNPMNHQLKVAAMAIEKQWVEMGYDSTKAGFWDSVVQQLEADGWQIPKNSSPNSNGPPIVPNRFGGPNPGGGGNANARRQTSQPTGGAGRQTSAAKSGTGPKDWNDAEKYMARLFGNHKGDRAKLLDGQYKLGKK